MTYELITERGFTPSGASDFLREYRATLAFANLDSTDSIGESGQGEDDTHGEGDHGGAAHNRPKPKGPDMLSIPVPIAGGSPIYVEGKFPVSESDWTQFIAVLNAMKPGLVAAVHEPDPGAGDFLPDPPDEDE